MSRKKYARILRNSKRRIDRRLRRKQWDDQTNPIMTGSNIHYEVSDKFHAISCGGIGVFHKLAQRGGLVKEINKRLKLLKVHLPYHESDHVLNIAYNVLTGGKRLEDIELRRQDETFLDALGAQRIPDPTTAGDFTRRFEQEDIITLMDCINTCRQKIWAKRGKEISKDVLIDVDGTIAPTLGECKQGIGLSYKGIWGYAPLIISLANTKEPLYLVNRPGNAPSHKDSAEWIDKAIELVEPHAKRITLRGDTDFSLTVHFDRWAEKVDFVFGMDAHKVLVEKAEEISEADWELLKRKPKWEIKTQERQKPENVKEKIVREREFENIRLKSEHVAEFSYRPTKCKRNYRVVVLRKNLSIEKGESVLFDDIRYFFYITTREDLTPPQVVELANGRCDQENVIEQLKNGVNAMRMPVDNLMSNWAYMVIASLAWTLKAWFGLMTHYRSRGVQILKMEFRQFLNTFVYLPCQIIRTGRKIVFRSLCYNSWLKDFFTAWKHISVLKFT